MKRTWFTVGIILLFVGTCIIPAIAQDTERTLPASRGNWLYTKGDRRIIRTDHTVKISPSNGIYLNNLKIAPCKVVLFLFQLKFIKIKVEINDTSQLYYICLNVNQQYIDGSGGPFYSTISWDIPIKPFTHSTILISFHWYDHQGPWDYEFEIWKLL